MDFLSPKKMIIYFEKNVSKNLLVAYNLFLDIYYTQWYGKKLPKYFLIGILDVFLKSCSCRPLRFFSNDTISCTTIVRLPSGLLWVVTWGLSNSIVWEMIGLHNYFTGRKALIQKIVFSVTSQVLQKGSYNFNIIYHKFFWSQIIFPLMSFILYKRSNKGPKSFVTVKMAFLKRLLLTISWFPQN